MSTSARPKVRGACEYCHRRKIRCIISPGDNACQNCAHNGVTCLFAPRSKPGRPRRFPSDVTGRPEASTSWARNEGDESLDHSPLHSPSLAAPAGPSDGLSDTPFDLSMPDFDEWMNGNATDNIWTPEGGTPKTTAEKWALGYFNPLPPAMDVEPLETSSFLSSRKPAALPISPPQSTRHTPPSAVPLDATEIIPDGAFTATLETCRRLDDYCRHVDAQQHPIPSADDDILVLAGKVCGEAQSKAFELNSANAALLLAAVLKVLELCNTIFQRFLTTNTRTDQQLLLLKRLDLLLLQAKIFLGQAKQRPGVLKVVEIHNAIDMAIRNEFSTLSWGDTACSAD